MNPEAIFHWSVSAIAAITTGLVTVWAMSADRTVRPARATAVVATILAGVMTVLAARQYVTGLWPGECSFGNHFTTWRETSSGQFVQEPASRAEMHR